MITINRKAIAAAGTTVENEPIVKSDGAGEVFQWQNSTEDAGEGIYIREDSAGVPLRLGVGVAAPTVPLDVVGDILATSTGTNTIKSQSAATARLLVNCTGSGGREYGMYTGGDGHLGFYDYDASATRLTISSAGLATFAAGINVGNVASATATSLDWYEEGTHVATIACTSSGSVTVDGSYNTLKYTRVGNTVFVTGYLSVSSVSAPVGFLRISLPIAPAAGVSRSSASLSFNSVATANVSEFWGQIKAGVAGIDVYLGDATSVQSDSAQEMQVGTDIRISAQYTV